MKNLTTILILSVLLFACSAVLGQESATPPRKLSDKDKELIAVVEMMLQDFEAAKKEDKPKLIESLMESDKVAAPIMLKYALKFKDSALKVDMLHILHKVDPVYAVKLENNILTTNMALIDGKKDFNIVRLGLWEMQAVGAAAAPSLWELYEKPENATVKHLILRAIMELKLPETREQILKELQAGQLDPPLLIKAVAEFKDTDGLAKQALLPLLQHQDVNVKLAAFDALLKLQAPELYPDAISKLANGDVLVRDSATRYVEGYIKISAANAEQAAGDVIKRFPENYKKLSPIILTSYLKLLSLAHTENAFEFLKGKLEMEDDLAYKAKLIQALGGFGTEQAYILLVDRLTDIVSGLKEEDAPLSMEIVKSMRQPIDDKLPKSNQVVGQLIVLLNSKTLKDDLSVEVVITLQVLTGQQSGLDPKIWADWWEQQKRPY